MVAALKLNEHLGMLKNPRFLTAAAGHTSFDQQSACRAVQQMDSAMKGVCKYVSLQQIRFLLSGGGQNVLIKKQVRVQTYSSVSRFSRAAIRFAT